MLADQIQHACVAEQCVVIALESICVLNRRTRQSILQRSDEPIGFLVLLEQLQRRGDISGGQIRFPARAAIDEIFVLPDELVLRRQRFARILRIVIFQSLLHGRQIIRRYRALPREQVDRKRAFAQSGQRAIAFIGSQLKQIAVAGFEHIGRHTLSALFGLDEKQHRIHGNETLRLRRRRPQSETTLVVLTRMQDGVQRLQRIGLRFRIRCPPSPCRIPDAH